MNVRYRVELSQAERDQLTAMLRGGHHAARKLNAPKSCWLPMAEPLTPRLLPVSVSASPPSTAPSAGSSKAISNWL